MSRFTTEVRYICENASGLTPLTGFNDVEAVLDASVENIFNFPFPIFDENYRIPLEKKILRHYYTREICEETVGLWKLRLCQKLNEIMPYYNQLYSSELLQFNPLYDIDLTTRHDREDNGNTSLTNTHNDTTTIDRDTTETNTHNDTTTIDTDTTENNTHNDTTNFERDETLNNTHTDTTVLDGENSLTNTHNDTDTATKWDVYSDTPQGALTNVDNNTYLTNARKITDNKNNQGGYTNAGTEDSTTTNNGTFANTAHEETETTSTGAYANTGTVDTTTSNTGRYSNTGTDDSTTVNTGGYSNTGTSRNTEEYMQTVIGKTASKSYSKLLLEFRETFLNIDAMILRDLRPCFFGLWE